MVPGVVERAVDAYVAAWNTPDDIERLRLLRIGLHEDAIFKGPTGDFAGHAAVADFIVALRSRVGAAIVSRGAPLEATGTGYYRFGWHINRPDGSPLMNGSDEVEVGEDGRLLMISVAL